MAFLLRGPSAAHGWPSIGAMTLTSIYATSVPFRLEALFATKNDLELSLRAFTQWPGGLCPVRPLQSTPRYACVAEI